MLTWAPDVQAGVDLDLAADLVRLLEPAPYHFHAAEGFRSWARQHQLYQAHLAGGPLAAAPGASAHGVVTRLGLPAARAVDLELLAPGSIVPGAMVWYPDPPTDAADYLARTPAGWRWLWDAVAGHPRLHSLWKAGDGDHVEIYHWRAGFPLQASQGQQA